MVCGFHLETLQYQWTLACSAANFLLNITDTFCIFNQILLLHKSITGNCLQVTDFVNKSCTSGPLDNIPWPVWWANGPPLITPDIDVYHTLVTAKSKTTVKAKKKWTLPSSDQL